jgi:hypothetical protein
MSNNPSDSKSMLVNPDRILVDEVALRLRPARKTKPLWAKQVDAPQQFRSIEAVQQLQAGDYLCRGIQGEFWPQSEKNSWTRTSRVRRSIATVSDVMTRNPMVSWSMSRRSITRSESSPVGANSMARRVTMSCAAATTPATSGLSTRRFLKAPTSFAMRGAIE